MVVVHVNRSWKKKPQPNLVIKKNVLLCWKTNPRQRSACFSAIHTKSARAGFPGVFCCIESGEASKDYVNVCFSSSTSIKLLGKLLFLLFVCFCFLSSCELLLGTNLPQVLPPFDVILILNLNPNSGTLQKKNTKRKKILMIRRCQANLFIHTYYKESTGFTSLTQTFLFCTCIPALHDCSRCGLRET